MNKIRTICRIFAASLLYGLMHADKPASLTVLKLCLFLFICFGFPVPILNQPLVFTSTEFVSIGKLYEYKKVSTGNHHLQLVQRRQGGSIL